MAQGKEGFLDKVQAIKPIIIKSYLHKAFSICQALIC